MSEQNKTLELKDEDLKKVNGGFGEQGLWNTIVAYFQQDIHPRVKVRYKDGYGKEVIAYGYAIDAGGTAAFNPTIIVKIDGWSNGKTFSPSNVELVE